MNGDITYDGTIQNGGRYELSTHQGDMAITMPENANATVSVNTFNGSFESDYPVTLTRKEPAPEVLLHDRERQRTGGPGILWRRHPAGPAGIAHHEEQGHGRRRLTCHAIRSTLAALAALTVLVTAGAAAQQKSDDSFHWTGAIAAGKTLRIQDVNGSIQATGTSGEGGVRVRRAPGEEERSQERGDPGGAGRRRDDDLRGMAQPAGRRRLRSSVRTTTTTTGSQRRGRRVHRERPGRA